MILEAFAESGSLYEDTWIELHLIGLKSGIVAKVQYLSRYADKVGDIAIRAASIWRLVIHCFGEQLVVGR